MDSTNYNFIKDIERENPYIFNLINKATEVNIRNLCILIDELSVYDKKNEFYDAVDSLMIFFVTSKIKINLGQFLYRARVNIDDGFFTKLSDLSYPPDEFVTCEGRLNCINQSVYYSSENHMLSMLEVTGQLYEKKGICTVVESVCIKDNELLIINLYPDKISNIYSQNINNSILLGSHNYADDMLKTNIDITLYNKLKLIRNYIFDRITTYPSSKINCYKITSTIANILFKNFHADGLVYPTVCMSGLGSCLVLNKKSYDENFMPRKALRFEYEYFEKSRKHKSPFSIKLTHFSERLDGNQNMIWEPYQGNDSVQSLVKFKKVRKGRL